MKAQINVSQLPYSIFRAVANYLDDEDAYNKLQRHISFGSKLLAKYNQCSRGESLLYSLGDDGRTVKDLVCLLDKARLVEPQLILRRKFKNIVITKQTDHDLIDLSCGTDVSFHCEATGFPYPCYQWYDGTNSLPGATGSTLNIKVQCDISDRIFHCLVTNSVPKNPQWSDFYARNSPEKSAAESRPIRVSIKCDRSSSAHSQTSRCDGCDCAEKVMKLKLNYDSRDKSGDAISPRSLNRVSQSERGTFNAKNSLEPLVASDKVALILSNSGYKNLPQLATPTCDGQALAEGLLNCDFKTVTLSDLNAAEMRLVVQEYCKLLGAGVYALFYFVGHGFEASGQCYLLPVDAPEHNYTCHDCLCAEEVLTLMQETDPALNVILLDVCRRLPSSEDVSLLKDKIFKPKVNRNTVFGYATSFGEGAYEVRGEVNGIFMKHFKKHLEARKPITDVLSLTMRDLERDAKAADVQFPEIRTNLTRPRGLKDETDYSGHTRTFDCRTFKWQQLHELPDPIKVHVESLNLLVVIWFDFCGHFVNMLYAFTTIYCVFNDLSHSEEVVQNDEARKYLAYLQFPEHIETNEPVVCEESEDDGLKISVRLLIKHLQRYKDCLSCQLDVRMKETNLPALSPIEIDLGKILIMKLEM